jgi:hypothetical protein
MVPKAAAVPVTRSSSKQQKVAPVKTAPKPRQKQSAKLSQVDQCLPAEVNELNEVNNLKAEVHRLNDLVNSLSTKLNFVLSFLQLSDDQTTSQVEDSSTTVGAVPTAGACAQKPQLNGNETKPLYSTVLMKRPNNFREAAVSAVCADLRQKENRKNSIIVSGLPNRALSDKVSVSNLVKAEFNLDIDISTCKRLGLQVDGKIQPLLVVLKNPDHVCQILSDAKCLRHSTDVTVQSQVYVNPHLTKAEAMVAYEQRCQRRQRNLRPAPNATSATLDSAKAPLVKSTTDTDELEGVFCDAPSAPITVAHQGHEAHVSSYAVYRPTSVESDSLQNKSEMLDMLELFFYATVVSTMTQCGGESDWIAQCSLS